MPKKVNSQESSSHIDNASQKGAAVTDSQNVLHKSAEQSQGLSAENTSPPQSAPFENQASNPVLSNALQAPVEPNKSSLVSNHPPVDSNNPLQGSNNSQVISNDPKFAANNPSVTLNNPSFTVNNPAFAANNPAFTANNPAFATNNPPPFFNPAFAAQNMSPQQMPLGWSPQASLQPWNMAQPNLQGAPWLNQPPLSNFGGMPSYMQNGMPNGEPNGMQGGIPSYMPSSVLGETNSDEAESTQSGNPSQFGGGNAPVWIGQNPNLVNPTPVPFNQNQVAPVNTVSWQNPSGIQNTAPWPNPTVASTPAAWQAWQNPDANLNSAPWQSTNGSQNQAFWQNQASINLGTGNMQSSAFHGVNTTDSDHEQNREADLNLVKAKWDADTEAVLDQGWLKDQSANSNLTSQSQNQVPTAADVAMVNGTTNGTTSVFSVNKLQSNSINGAQTVGMYATQNAQGGEQGLNQGLGVGQGHNQSLGLEQGQNQGLGGGQRQNQSLGGGQEVYQGAQGMTNPTINDDSQGLVSDPMKRLEQETVNGTGQRSYNRSNSTTNGGNSAMHRAQGIQQSAAGPYNSYAYWNNPTDKWYNSLGIHILFVAIISLLLMIPNMFFGLVLSDREGNQTYAIESMTRAWGSEQILSDPELVIPVSMINEISTSSHQVSQGYEYEDRFIRPYMSETKIALKSEKRFKGNYEATLYTLEVNQKGEFHVSQGLSMIQNNSRLEILQNSKVSLVFSLSDTKGMDEIKQILINGQPYDVFPSDEYSGFEVRIPSELVYDHDTLTFDVTYMLRGSQSLGFYPIAKISRLDIEAEGSNPNFTGDFLPRERNVDLKARTFTAQYYQNNLSTGQSMVSSSVWTDSRARNHSIMIELFDDADSYVLIDRLTKYVLLFIAMTFVTVLAFEIVSKRLVSLVQYVVIGVALILFYLVLLSLSEHFSFTFSYVTGALVLSCMISLYIKAMFNSKKHGFCLLLMLWAMYAILFAIVHVQAYAMLVGTTLLVIMLGIVMYITRHLNSKDSQKSYELELISSQVKAAATASNASVASSTFGNSTVGTKQNYSQGYKPASSVYATSSVQSAASGHPASCYSMSNTAASSNYSMPQTATSNNSQAFNTTAAASNYGANNSLSVPALAQETVSGDSEQSSSVNATLEQTNSSIQESAQLHGAQSNASDTVQLTKQLDAKDSSSQQEDKAADKA